MNTINNLAATRINQRLSSVQTRLSEITNKTGISFSHQLNKAQEVANYENTETESNADYGDVQESLPTYKNSSFYKNETDDEIYKTSGTDKTTSSDNSTSSLPSGDYDDLIAETANKYGVDPLFVKAICYTESGYNPDATSGKGAMGLMQLMPSTADYLNVADPYDPEENIDGGVRLLAELLEEFDGDMLKAAAAYNCGSARVKSEKTLPSETQNYIVLIQNILQSVGVDPNSNFVQG